MIDPTAVRSQPTTPGPVEPASTDRVVVRPKSRAKPAPTHAAATGGPPSTPPLSNEQREQLAELIRQHQVVVYAYLRARVAQPSDADDLLQEVFLRFHAAQARFDENREPLPFVMGIARNLLRERARRLRRRNEITWTEICLDVEAETPETEARPHAEWIPTLNECMQSLGPNARMALELHYRNKQKFKQIGQKLGRTAGAIKLLMFRARQALKKCLDGKNDPVS